MGVGALSSNSPWLHSCTHRSRLDMLLQVLPAVTVFTDTARSGVLPPKTATAFPWLEKTSGGDDPVYGGYYMTSGEPDSKQGLLWALDATRTHEGFL